MIEKVNQFQYLDVVFNSRGNFFQAKKHLHAQASKAMHSLLKNIRSNSLPVDLSLQPFDWSYQFCFIAVKSGVTRTSKF